MEDDADDVSSEEGIPIPEELNVSQIPLIDHSKNEIMKNLKCSVATPATAPSLQITQLPSQQS